MERWSRRQWRECFEARPDSPEAERGLSAAEFILRRADQSSAELFGGPLDSARALRILTRRDPSHEDDPKAVRRLRGELLSSLLLSPPEHLPPAVHETLVREVAEVLRRSDAKKAQELREAIHQLSQPRPRPPVFSAPRQSPPDASPAVPPIRRRPPVFSAPRRSPPTTEPTTPHVTLPLPEPEPEASTLIRWEVGVASRCRVRVTLHDALGRTVRSLFDGTLDAGVHHCEAEVPEETVVEIGPLGYVRMELPGGRWQQGIFLPGARTDSSSTHRLERDRSLAGDKPVPPLPPTPRGQK